MITTLISIALGVGLNYFPISRGKLIFIITEFLSGGVLQRMINILSNIPVVGQAYGLTKTAMKVYNCTDPINATKIALVSVVEDCSPPQVKYPLKCGILLAQVVVAIATGGNPFSVALSLGAIRQIIEK